MRRLSAAPTSRVVSVAFGIVMVLTAGLEGGPVVLAVLAAALAAVVAGLFDRRAAVLAVLLAIVALAIGGPTPVFAAVSGLSAAAYLLTGFAEDSGANTLTVPTVVGLIGFTLAGLAATAITTKVTWVPLLAPVVMTAVLIVVAIPLLRGGRTGPAGEHDSTGGYE
jgi:hypothetical protein